MKKCTKCKEEKDEALFDIDRRRTNGLRSWCRECDYKCNRAVDARLRKYGISRREYERMCKDQDYKCKICESRFEVLNIDHDHKTFVIRGLLCLHCNTGLGLFKDNPKFFQRAIDYLENASIEIDYTRMFMAL